MNGQPFEVADAELCNVAHREYTQAYALGANHKTVNYTDSQSKGDYTYIADVLGNADGFVIAEMRNRFKEGDLLEVLSPDENFTKTFVAQEIFDAKGERVDDAKLVQEKYRIKCPYPLQEGSYLRRKVVK